MTKSVTSCTGPQLRALSVNRAWLRWQYASTTGTCIGAAAILREEALDSFSVYACAAEITKSRQVPTANFTAILPNIICFPFCRFSAMRIRRGEALPVCLTCRRATQAADAEAASRPLSKQAAGLQRVERRRYGSRPDGHQRQTSDQSGVPGVRRQIRRPTSSASCSSRLRSV
jgi:hypothetical protein